ncbi:hypothetical protein [Sinomicrobium weinanense]|uniref:Addiction module protein n=1 Tax=Sinomicrobium weinanense TaxID=2842200 RepID=A0A926Q190_9FLAO|nr:hypothetical protein [Sinomicrobium weinanense]MBC9795443.1 hypothetical protein [Sinomicrobium weinanense]MBU3123968.1 hypothetical protein [Sinomicrobium weinanense]
MDVQLLKLELIDLLLHTKNKSVLKKIKDIFQENQEIPDTLYDELDKDRIRHLNEETPSYEWEEVKARLQQKYGL